MLCIILQTNFINLLFFRVENEKVHWYGKKIDENPEYIRRSGEMYRGQA